jgi:hypothetical protein
MLKKCRKTMASGIIAKSLIKHNFSYELNIDYIFMRLVALKI